jgi:hypothetical protein
MRRHVSAWLGAIILAVLVWPAAMAAAERDPWRDWLDELHRRCPSHRIDWLCDQCNFDLIDEFASTLDPKQQKKFSDVADSLTNCENETGGFTCEFSTALRAFRKTHLLGRLADFACHRYRCTEAALCNKL